MKRWIFLIGMIAFLTSNIDAQSFRMGRTTGAVAYMEYGLGDDRLGGAKMGYLDSNVVVRVVDSVEGDYVVRLSRLHQAYIPKAAIRWGQEVKPRDYYLSGSIRVIGDTLLDVVTVNLDERLPYRSQHFLDPNGIVVDIFGITSNTNWITQMGSTREISQVWYEQIEDDVLRIHIRLKDRFHWGHSITYENLKNRLLIRVNRPPEKDLKKWKIAIDAGHGGTNTGAAGIHTRVLEKDQTLLFARELEKTLRKSGFRNIFMTRTTDTTLSMEERIVMLRREAPDLLLSLHLNSASNDTVRGTSTFYRYAGFRPLTQAILKRMLELGLSEYGNVGNFNFALSGPTEYPNCLVEIAFLSNPEDERRIVDPRFHKAVAKKILEGLRDFSKYKVD